jgi:hypothetical protein
LEGNLVYRELGPLPGRNRDDDMYAIGPVLSWGKGGRTFDGAGAAPEDRRNRGHGTHSLAADPRFAAPERGVFRPKPGSPAERERQFLKRQCFRGWRVPATLFLLFLIALTAQSVARTAGASYESTSRYQDERGSAWAACGANMKAFKEINLRISGSPPEVFVTVFR